MEYEIRGGLIPRFPQRLVPFLHVKYNDQLDRSEMLASLNNRSARLDLDKSGIDFNPFEKSVYNTSLGRKVIHHYVGNLLAS
jgi:hypothetical protein